MGLPSPDEITLQEYWDNFWIRTPTFKLTPIEKPDMSPYLVHLTGKNQLISILRGENSEKLLTAETGFLRSSLPYYDTRPTPVRVVCFSESPIFALDFFRYKSQKRWEYDHRYGIGFLKTDLITLGVRPLITTDDGLSKLINHLFIKWNENELNIEQNEFKERIGRLLRQLYQLNFPLLETLWQQGFSWEKEWRYPDEVGLPFSLRLIKIICCPVDEVDEIKDVLKGLSQRIRFVKHWHEYDEVTDFLQKREFHLNKVGLEDLQNVNNLERIKYVRDQTRRTIEHLKAYRELSARMHDTAEQSVVSLMKKLEAQLEDVEKRKSELEKG